MKTLPILLPGDCVEIIAPASRCSDVELKVLQELLSSWRLNPIVDADLFGKDLLCSHTDIRRAELLNQALSRRGTKAIICARGGYGSLKLIPSLMRLPQPKTFKWFVGMSDVTALHLFFQQQWQWPVIHGAADPGRFSAPSIATLKSLLFGEISQLEWAARPLNLAAEANLSFQAPVTGGNLTLVQTSIGTAWQLQGAGKIIVLEEVGERGYRLDRMLEHLRQASLLQGVRALIFADFLQGDEPDGSSLIQPVLARFAETCAIPVLQIQGVGHGHVNLPMIMGTEGVLQLGRDAKLVCTKKQVA
ncbi:MAG: LD-carboxypeptidase [Legionellales bacterium]|nr:LD-carboxypeptidase [Legionellales bacterium]